MRRSVLHAAAWLAATGAAVALSWFGVRSVLSATAYEPPRTLPVAGPAADPTGGAEPETPATRRPSTPGPGSDSPGRTGAPAGNAESTAGRPPDDAQPSGEPTGSRVEGYRTEGGRVVFDLGDTSASLVSATPNAGWEMQVWKSPGWIRVTFTSQGRAWSVFCTWHGHPPTVETYQG